MSMLNDMRYIMGKIIPAKRHKKGVVRNGKKVFWWFSDKAIKEHTKDILTLKPL